MDIEIRAYRDADLPSMLSIWNEVVAAGNAFPQELPMSLDYAKDFFAAQRFTAVAEKGGQVVGLYILHPNNVGRCGHIANASYGVLTSARGQGIGEKMVRHSLDKGHELGFRLLQFNAVVAANKRAIQLYEKLGFVRLGMIPGGFRLKNGSYQDIILFYHTL